MNYIFNDQIFVTTKITLKASRSVNLAYWNMIYEIVTLNQSFFFFFCNNKPGLSSMLGQQFGGTH